MIRNAQVKTNSTKLYLWLDLELDLVLDIPHTPEGVTDKQTDERYSYYCVGEAGWDSSSRRSVD